jgi:hypothetical protein
MSDEEGPILPEPIEPEPVPEPEPEPIGVKVEDVSDLIDPTEDTFCHGKTREGKACGMRRLIGSDFCQWHQPDGVVPKKGVKYKYDQAKKAASEVKPEEQEYGVLKPYPFHDGGVSENAAIRMISMVIPQCPVDGNPELKQKDGTYKPNPNFTGEPNCQQAYKINNHGIWDVKKCEELGHDPWHTKFRRAMVEEVLDKDGYVVDTRTKYHVEERLNVIQVSDNPRHSNRQEVALALAKGCRFLEDFGIASPCEFRNCTQPWTIDTRYGKYCSERHARLIAADFQKVMLPVGGDPYTEDQSREERESILANLNIRKGT